MTEADLPLACTYEKCYIKDKCIIYMISVSKGQNTF